MSQLLDVSMPGTEHRRERGTVLIVTGPSDIHADSVVAECHRRGLEVFRLHPEDYPQRVGITLRADGSALEGVIENEHHRTDLASIACAWYRHPEAPVPDPRLSQGVAEYVRFQCNEVLEMLYGALEGRWIVSPFALDLAEVKMLQLVRAAAAGLSTPHTLVTSSRSEAERFRGEWGGAVAVKPPNVQGTCDPDGLYRFPLTTVWDRPARAGEIESSPAMFQPYVPKGLDIRCVAIGQQVFAAEADAQAHPETVHDARALGSGLRYRPHALPDAVEQALLRLVRSFGVHFCSADLVLTPAGEYVFLDLNPNGQWLWLESENQAALPLTSALVDFMEAAGRGGPSWTKPGARAARGHGDADRLPAAMP